MNLFFDTETSDLIKFKLPDTHESQPWVCQLAMVLTDNANNPLNTVSVLIQSNGRPMSPGAQKVHGISKELVDSAGIHEIQALGLFVNLAMKAENIIAHNISFDLRLLKIIAHRTSDVAVEDMEKLVKHRSTICTMKSSTNFCNLPGRYGKPKWPKLEELHKILFDEGIPDAHDALIDVNATRRCYFELKQRGVL